MKYISLDIETSGLDPNLHQVLEVAAVIEDTERTKTSIEDLPHINFVVAHENIVWSKFAHDLNYEWYYGALNKDRTCLDPVTAIIHFLGTNNLYPPSSRIIAGKNVGSFDMQFLPELKPHVSHRFIDVGSVFMDWKNGPQSLSKLVGHDVKHRALEDARDVIRVLRKAYA